MKALSRKLKVGIIGSGGRGAALGAIIHSLRQKARVVACCDNDLEVLERNKLTYGTNIFTTSDYRELLERVLDAVIIATPDYLHEKHAIAALSRGFSVYLEKPMAITVAGCDRVLRQAAKCNDRLYLGHNMRHMPFVRKMKSLIATGAIGEVKACWVRHFVGNGGDYYFRDWHAERRYSTGLLLQKAAHDIDIIHWLCGGYSRLVNAMGGLTVYGGVTARLPALPGPRKIALPHRRLEIWPPSKQHGLNNIIDVEDLSMIQMRLDNGVFAQYSQCHYTPDYWRSYVVIGTEGRIENFGNGEKGTCVRLWNKRKQGYDMLGDKTYTFPVLAGGHAGADRMTVAEFVRFAREGGTTETSAVAARESVATAVMATESLRSRGVPLAVPPPPAIVRSVEAKGAKMPVYV